MIPIITPSEMAAIDASASEPPEVLIGRAGAAVARQALRMMGGGYGRRVVVVAGKGNNGADGRVAARRLAQRGARVAVCEAAAAPGRLPKCDLVIDAAYGTGLRGGYDGPDPGSAPVLAVDIPSGIDGITGVAGGSAVSASCTVTFAAYKPGLLLADGAHRSGEIFVADIGLDVGGAEAFIVEDSDINVGDRTRESHKWMTAVCVVAGSPGMMGAPLLVTRGAMRAGSGYVRLGVPGGDPAALPAGNEAVAFRVDADDWATDVLPELERCKVLIIGPGLGPGEVQSANVRRLVAEAPVPVVVDADGLGALGDDAAEVIKRRTAPTVLTPHEGEFEKLAGAKPGADRFAAVRELARRTGATVLLKGSTTIVSSPAGELLVSTSGSPRLATAGTGDVLSGVVGGLLAAGLDGLKAAAFAAHVHGRAAGLGRAVGLVAGDVPELVSQWLSRA